MVTTLSRSHTPGGNVSVAYEGMLYVLCIVEAEAGPTTAPALAAAMVPCEELLDRCGARCARGSAEATDEPRSAEDGGDHDVVCSVWFTQ